MNVITFSKFGKKGRLGNQLFQFASMIGLCKEHNAELILPKWGYEKYFKNIASFYSSGTKIPSRTINEAAYHYTPEYYKARIVHGVNNLDGYFQSKRYWQSVEEEVKSAFEFEENFKNSVKEKYSKALEKPCIAVSVRRGDFVGNKNYYQLPVRYYINALEKLNSDDYNVIFFSDDTDYCKLHFGFMENAFFADNRRVPLAKELYFAPDFYAIEQLCLMTMCNHYVISNSTFSWWGAYLGKSKQKRVIRPLKALDKLGATHNEKDFYPEEWEIGSEEKIDLSDVTFMIPVHFDHKDRSENLSLNVCMLQREFQTNIHITEQGTNEYGSYSNYGCKYTHDNSTEFHRTRMLNDMARASETPIIANWDADVFVPPAQLLQSVKNIRSGKAETSYPYDGRFARVDRRWLKKLEHGFDVGVFCRESFKGTKPQDKLSVGGAILFNKQKYFECGGENEKFISYGPEDVERWLRFYALSKTERIKGILYHLDHFRGVNSRCVTNPHDKANHDELEKIKSMTPEQMMEYIKTW